MAAATRIGPKFQIVIPKQIREAARLRVGDYVEATLTRQGIVLRPKALVDRGLERALSEALKDIKAGRLYGPYNSAKEAVRGLHRAMERERKPSGEEVGRQSKTGRSAKRRSRGAANARNLQR